MEGRLRELERESERRALEGVVRRGVGAAFGVGGGDGEGIRDRDWGKERERRGGGYGYGYGDTSHVRDGERYAGGYVSCSSGDGY